MNKIILKPGKEKSLLRFHPWVFSGAIDSKPSSLVEGELVEILSSNKENLGCGFWSNGSIAVKMVFFDKSTPTADDWKTKIEQALKLRLNFQFENNHTDMYRLINAEGDGLPGVIADRYGDAVVIHYQHQGAKNISDIIESGIKAYFGDKIRIIYSKYSDKNNKAGSYSLGSASPDHVATENGHKYFIDWETGQKTGFFLDQRNNRALVQKLSSGRTVLNAFSYSGGFSVCALAGGALSVDSVDSSESALELAERNVGLNFPSAKHSALCEDCLDYLRKIDNRYDLIILDPPAFAKHRDAVRGAVDGYRDINRLAIKSIKSSGLLFTFSCSQLVSKELFQEAVFSGAAQAGRSVKVIYRLGQSEDHPFNIFHPEGEYLKGLVLEVS